MLISLKMQLLQYIPVGTNLVEKNWQTFRWGWDVFVVSWKPWSSMQAQQCKAWASQETGRRVDRSGLIRFELPCNYYFFLNCWFPVSFLPISYEFTSPTAQSQELRKWCNHDAHALCLKSASATQLKFTVFQGTKPSVQNFFYIASQPC